MVKKANIEKFFGDRYEFYSKGTYDENGEYLGRIWDNELERWVAEQFQMRHPEKADSKIDKRCNIRMIDGKRKKFYVSRLIYQAFHPEWDMFKDPRREQINHKEEDETCNNDLDNLELMTAKENSNYGTRNQRVGEGNKLAKRDSKYERTRSKPVVCIETGEFFWSARNAAISLGKSSGGVGSISMCCRGLQHTAYGYHWRYATEEEIQAHL